MVNTVVFNIGGMGLIIVLERDRQSQGVPNSRRLFFRVDTTKLEETADTMSIGRLFSDRDVGTLRVRWNISTFLQSEI